MDEECEGWSHWEGEGSLCEQQVDDTRFVEIADFVVESSVNQAGDWYAREKFWGNNSQLGPIRYFSQVFTKPTLLVTITELYTMP